MRILAISGALALSFLAGDAFAQTTSGQSVRISPGQVCAQNKCVRFSRDLSAASIQGRRAVSVSGLNLRSNPVIPLDTFREIYFLALRQSGVNGNRG